MLSVGTPLHGVRGGRLGEPSLHSSHARRRRRYALQKHLNDLRALPVAQLLQSRYERYRKLGVYEETVT